MPHILDGLVDFEDDPPVSYQPKVTVQFDAPSDPGSLVLFVDDSRWKINAAARILHAALEWFQAEMSASIAERDDLPAREQEVANAEQAQKTLYALLYDLVYGDEKPAVEGDYELS